MAPYTHKDTISSSRHQLKPQLKTITKATKASKVKKTVNDVTDSNEPVVRVGASILVQDDVSVEVLKRLGNGAYGEVYKVRTLNYNKCFALKVTAADTTRQTERAIEEADLLMYLSQQNLGKFILETYYSFWYSRMGREVMCHISELLDRSVFDIIDRSQALHPAVVKAVGFQILSALECLHSVGVTHCDIKPDNIMFVDLECSHLRVKVIDFGLSHFTRELPRGKMMQNIMYRAPEVVFNLPLSEKMDIWSFAVMMNEMFTGLDLFPVKTEPELSRYMEGYVGLPDEIESVSNTILIRDVKEEWEMVKAYQERHPEDHLDVLIDRRDIRSLELVPEFGYNNRMGHGVSREDRQFLSVLKMMLEPNAEERIGAKEALQLPFFSSFDGDYNPSCSEPAVAPSTISSPVS